MALWNEHPDSFSRLLGILESIKDPFHAIASLEDGKVLSASEFFIIAHLSFSVSRVLAEMKAISGRVPLAGATSRGSSGAVSTGVSSTDDLPPLDTAWPWPSRVVPPSLSDIERKLLAGSSGQPVFYVSDAYSPELGKVRAERKSKEKAWRAEMAKEAELVEKLLGKRPGLREEIAIRKSSPELLEKARLMPELGETRETLTHVHFRLKATKEAVRLEREINRLRQKEVSLEEEVLGSLSKAIWPSAGRLGEAAWALGELDFLLARAELARKWGARKPEIKTSAPESVLIIEDARHPEIVEEVQSRGGLYQPISIEADSVVSVITGPNMGGKTATLATIGLSVALAQWGFLVPCKRMVFSLYDFVYFQPATAEKPGLSSFASEVVALKEPVKRVEGDPEENGQPERGLILLDEIGRGTNPSQGLCLYAALLSHFMEKDRRGSTVIATTHYHGLSAILGVPHWQVMGLVPSLDDLVEGSERWANGASGINWLYRHMDYRLQRVGPDTPTPQDALLVARLLGLDEAVIKKAEEFYQRRRGSLTRNEGGTR